MKKIISIWLVAGLCACHPANQKDALATLPAFDLLLPDNTTILHSGQIPGGSPIVFLYFKPDCPFCRAETRTLLQHLDSLQPVRLFFLTGMSMDDLKQFTREYRLDTHPNIVVGIDYGHSFAKVFRPGSVPYLAIYDQRKRLVTIYKGGVPFKMIFDAIHA